MKTLSLHQPQNPPAWIHKLIGLERLHDYDFPLAVFYDLFEGDFNSDEAKICLTLLFALQEGLEEGLVEISVSDWMNWLNELARPLGKQEEGEQSKLESLLFTNMDASKLDSLSSDHSDLSNQDQTSPATVGEPESENDASDVGADLSADELLSEVLNPWIESTDFPISKINDLSSEFLSYQSLILFDAKQSSLSFSRYYQARRSLEKELSRILNGSMETQEFNEDLVESNLNQEQKLAVAASAKSKLSVVSGGPGTGKTRVIANIVAHYLGSGGDLARLKVMAPTGKAAFRLGESLKDLVKDSNFAEQVNEGLLSLQTSTIHRAIGLGSSNPRYHALRPLNLEMIVIDEASMIDLGLFLNLCNALGENCRIVLVGDMDQLPPVEVGSVFSGVLGALANLEQAKPVVLKKNYRSNVELQALASAVNESKFSDIEGCLSIKDHFNAGKVHCLKATDPKTIQKSLSHWCDHAYLEGKDSFLTFCLSLKKTETPGPGQLKLGFEKMKQYQVLCAIRQGAGGVNQCNEIFQEKFQEKLGKRFNKSSLYTGAVLMLLGNDYNRLIYNGDTGFVFENSKSDLYLALEGKRVGLHVDGFTLIPVHSLNRYEFAYAMTVHKSQGSEFQNVLLSAPNTKGSLFNRQLLYTAITRAKETLCILADPKDLAIASQTVRKGELVLNLS